MTKRKIALAAMVLGGTVIACQVVAGIERVDKTDPVAVEAGPDVLAVDSAVADPCAHVRPVPKPLVDDAPNDKLPDIYLALHHVDLAPSATNAVAPGFDLDQSCTCDTRPGSAFDGGASCTTGAKPFCDADGGIDNQIFNFARDYAAFIDVDQAANINGRISSGHQTVILVIKDYNGRANDSAVSFGTFSSEGMLEGPTCPGSTMAADGFSSPGWCGEDKWTASSSTVDGVNGLFLPKSIGTGYVSNYQFVVELNNPATIPFASYRLAIGSPISSGHLVPLDATLMPVDTSAGPALDRIKYWRVEKAVISGRIPVTDLLAAVGTIVTSLGDSGATKPPLCTTSTFAQVKGALCGQIDINQSKALDFIPNAKCDAISVGIGLTADSVRVQTVAPAPATTNVCYPSPDGGGPTAGPPGVTYQCP
jgi:hypothetical protein